MNLNLNSAASQSLPSIADKTIARVKTKVKVGGYNDPSKGITGGLATKNPKTGNVYLDCLATVLDGEHKGGKAGLRIGLHSANPKYAEQGMRLLRAIIESSHEVLPTDQSERAVKIRNECTLSDFDGIEFVARIDLEEAQPPYPARNVINYAITPNDSRYLRKSPPTHDQKA